MEQKQNYVDQITDINPIEGGGEFDIRNQIIKQIIIMEY